MKTIQRQPKILSLLESDYDVKRKDMSPQKWLIPNILPIENDKSSLMMLIARPKMGKSMFCLESALSLATGKSLFSTDNEALCKQMPVAVVCLSEVARRVHFRVQRMTQRSIPKHMWVSLESEYGTGCLPEINFLLSNYPEIQCVFVDTGEMLSAKTLDIYRSIVDEKGVHIVFTQNYFKSYKIHQKYIRRVDTIISLERKVNKFVFYEKGITSFKFDSEQLRFVIQDKFESCFIDIDML